MERRVERALARNEGAAALVANALRYLVAVQLALAEHRQDQQGRGPLEQLSLDPAGHASLPQIAVHQITM